MQNFESISSLKLMTNNTLSCIEYYFNNDSIFEIDEKDILFEYFNQLKIYENIEISIILFIMHIILEAKIEYNKVPFGKTFSLLDLIPSLVKVVEHLIVW